MAVVASALCVVFAAFMATAQVVVRRHQLGATADLAALSAAEQAWRGADHACAAARRVARFQRGSVVRCVLDGEVAELTAETRFSVLAVPRRVRVTARAGPASAAP